MDSAETPRLTEAIDRLWTQFLPQIEERVALLETAARDFASGRLSVEQREAANTAAHNLAGVLGSFGLTQGTVLARELEVLYSRENSLDPAMTTQLTQIAAELRTLIENRR